MMSLDEVFPRLEAAVVFESLLLILLLLYHIAFCILTPIFKAFLFMRLPLGVMGYAKNQGKQEIYTRFIPDHPG